MGATKRLFQQEQDKKRWHYEHCTIEYESDKELGTSAYCVEHDIDVTDVLPDNPPDYDDREEDE